MSGTRRKPDGFVFEQHFLKDDMPLVSSLAAAGNLKLVKGTNRSDYIEGQRGAENILGFGGNDEVWAGYGDDVVRGGNGADDLWGMNGNDILYGDAGNDRLFGGSYRDTLYGGAGNDQMDSSGGDWLYGEDGNDDFNLLSRDKAFGGSGNDTFTIGNRNIEIHGGTGIDTVRFKEQIARFSIEYRDEGVLVEYKKIGVGSPEPGAMLDEEIERIEFRNGVVIDRRNLSAPEIGKIWNGYSYVDLDSVVTTNIHAIVGTADPFARITVKSGNAILGTCIADQRGEWFLGEIDPDAISDVMNLVAIADFGFRGHSVSSSPKEIHTPFALERFNDSVGVMFEGPAKGYAGQLTTKLGDVNGDGIDDLAVAVGLTRAAVVYGGTGWDNGLPNLDTLAPERGYVIDINADAIRAVGDLNGDGIDDLAVRTEGLPGGVAIVFGSVTSPTGQDDSGRAVLSTDQLDGDGGVLLQGGALYDLFRAEICSAGDMNGDGIGDLLIGAPSYSGSVPNSGKAYVLFGSSTLHQMIADGVASTDLENLQPNQGFEIVTTVERNYMGREISAAGDINGDGYGDIVVSATSLNGSENKTKDYVIFGGADGFGTVVNGHAAVDLTSLALENGFLLQGNTSGNSQFTNIGDFNGDGVDDLFINTSAWVSGDVGQGYLVFGKAGTFGVTTAGQSVLDLASMSASEGVVFTGNMGGPVSSIGDFNGDGYDDFILQEGFIRVVYGSDEPLGELVNNQRVLDSDKIGPSFAIDIRGFYGPLNISEVATGPAGDINGDGYDDLLLTLGTEWWSDVKSRTYIVYGHHTTSSAPIILTGTSAAEILIGGADDDILDGQGGKDIFRGGAGDDVIRIGDAQVAQIRAGRGNLDMVEFAGAGITFDGRDFGNSELRGIEAFDLTGTGGNTLILAAADVFNLSRNRHGAFSAAESGNSLVVFGDGGDRLQLIDYAALGAEWERVEQDVDLDGSAGGDFDIYHLVGDKGVLASVAVDTDVGMIA